MSIHKECADHLRQNHRVQTGGKLGAGHAHEIVAAYFGYGSGAALRAETKHPLTDLDQAEILIPDLGRMDQRVQALQGLPTGLPSVDDLASQISDFLKASAYFAGKVWYTRDLAEYISDTFIQEQSMQIEDDLSGAIASTNAYFDELYVEEVDLQDTGDMLVAQVSGSLNGENDPDRAFHGDSIAFTTVVRFRRLAGRVAYETPEVETSGAVDDSAYYDEDA